MRVLVAYASKHGATATREIAERVARTMTAAGQQAQARPVTAAGDLAGYDAFVVYMEHWQKEATDFVRRNRAVLAGRPVWLFSSGPLGTEPTDAQGRDLTVAAEPKELAEFTQAIHPRGHRVFFGVLDPGTLGLGERAIRKLPAGRALLPEGDFRDWAQIQAWELLGENPSEIVLGQIGRPWKAAGATARPVAAPAAFAAYDKPGYAKIALSLRVDPRGATSSILVMETRVALTDAASLRRFRRYWMVIGPFSGLIRRVALRLLDTDLRQPGPPRTA